MKDDDDDIQEYVSSGWRKRQTSELNDEFDRLYAIHKRNEVLEEVAKAVYNFKAFEKDTMDSFAIYIRSMKR